MGEETYNLDLCRLKPVQLATLLLLFCPNVLGFSFLKSLLAKFSRALRNYFEISFFLHFFVPGALDYLFRDYSAFAAFFPVFS